MGSEPSAQKGTGKHLKLGGTHFEGTFFLKKRVHFLKIKSALPCILQNLGCLGAPRFLRL